MDHIDVMRKAIEFNGPEYIPLEVTEVSGIYDDYGTASPKEARILEGAEDFDALQATFSGVYKKIGVNEKGDSLYQSEWGFVRVIPKDPAYNYCDFIIIENPLADWHNLKDYKFPSPSVTDDFFKRVKKALKNHPDRFITAYIDPGLFETAFYIIGYENFFMNLYSKIDEIKYLFNAITDYHIELVEKWKELGAHMVSYFDILAGQQSLLFSPDFWRKHFKPFYHKIFSFIHQQGMYAGCGLDGKVLSILPDMKEVGMDVLDCRQPTTMGIDNLSKVCNGKLCVKSSIDMQTTLVRGNPKDVEQEAKNLVTKLGRRNGGFIALVLKWATLKYPEENVRASVEAFNHFRKKR